MPVDANDQVKQHQAAFGQREPILAAPVLFWQARERGHTREGAVIAP